MNIKEFITGYRGKDIPKELNEFNWASFLLTFIWGIPHKAWVTLFALPLLLIQLPYALNWVLFTIFQLYCGFNGNKWAYQNDWWMKPVDFRHKQMKWSIWAFVVTFVTPIVLICVATRFITKSPNNPIEFITNTQCSVVYKKLKKDFPKILINQNSNSNNIASQLTRFDKKGRLSGNSIIFGTKAGNDVIDVYTIIVEKNDAVCNIENRNCSVVSKYIMPVDLPEVGRCVFYFDNNKQILPDEQTEKSLKKGMNIFKYL